MTPLWPILGALVALLVWAPGAGAEEAKAPIRAQMMLNLLAPVGARPEAAFDLSLKEGPAPPLPSVAAGEVLPDGTVRYGSVTVTVKNPCPPGTAHYEPRPLPGRRPR